MKNKNFSLIAMIFLLLMTSVNIGIVNADDDHEEHEYEKYKYYEKDEHENEEDEDDYYNYTTVDNSYQSTWNIWTKTTNISKGELPFNEVKLVQVKNESGNSNKSLYAIPLDGELFVPGREIAQILGAEATFYNTSKILEVVGVNNALIFRVGTNVVYDNDLKFPIPAKAFLMNNDVYIPVSVISNGMGYAVEWRQEMDTLLFNPLTTTMLGGE